MSVRETLKLVQSNQKGEYMTSHETVNQSGANQLETNKAIVREFYDLSFNQGKPEEAVARYIGPYYRQHNPKGPDGAEPIIAYVKAYRKAFPELRVEFKRFIAEGDLVVLHSHQIPNPGDRGSAVVDIFRLENGKVVEHWDVHEEVPATSANSNTMF